MKNVYYLSGYLIGSLLGETDTHYVVFDKDGETTYINRELAEVREE